MTTGWDMFVDEVKDGGKLRSLGALVVNAGVTEGLYASEMEDGYWLYWYALYRLGKAQHRVQDVVFHRWVDMSQQHTGKLCKTIRNHLLVPFYWKGKIADFRDLFPGLFPGLIDDAEAATDDLLSSFEDEVRRYAAEHGMDADKALAGLKGWKKRK